MSQLHWILAYLVVFSSVCPVYYIHTSAADASGTAHTLADNGPFQPPALLPTVSDNVTVINWTELQNATDIANLTGLCGECPPGYFGNVNVSNCTGCWPGYCPILPFNVTDPNGTSTNETEFRPACQLCEDGYIAGTPGWSECYGCGPGQSNNTQHTACTPCQPGEESKLDGDPCTKCQVGYFSSGYGSTLCMACPPGTYQSVRGAQTCLDCGIGSYQPNYAAGSLASCLLCPSGTYCPNYRNAEAYPCVGLYTSDPGSPICSPGAGLYVVVVLCVSVGSAIVILVLCRICRRGSVSTPPVSEEGTFGRFRTVKRYGTLGDRYDNELGIGHNDEEELDEKEKAAVAKVVGAENDREPPMYQGF